MITSKEARSTFNTLVGGEELKEIIEYPPNGNWNKLYLIVEQYITQQEKVNELLEMYRKREINRNLPHPSHADEIIYTRKIDKLESELNDNK